MPIRMHKEEIDIDEALVRRLLTSQMPHLADRSMVMVEPWGTDHAIWRLGDDLVVRLPRIHWAAAQGEFEAEWLPRIAPCLPVEIPTPVAMGRSDAGYPYPWSIHRWIAGDGAALERIGDPIMFALQLADVVRALRTVSIDGAPSATNRARPLRDYDTETRHGIDYARPLIDADAATAVWEEALTARPHEGAPVWVQGDLEGNCLVRDGQLCGTVDWGSACVGDPAVDVQVVWSPLFTEASRAAFVDALAVDDDTLARSKGAAIHQACWALRYYLDTYPLIVERCWHKLAQLGVGSRERRS